MNRIKDIDSILRDLKDYLRAESASRLEGISDQVTSLSDAVDSDTSNIAMNIVVHNLPEASKEGLKLKEISMASAKRKPYSGNNKSGVVIAKCKSGAD